MDKTTTQNIAKLVVEYLANKRQLHTLPAIIKELTRLSQKAGLSHAAVVTSAVKLDDATKKGLTAFIKSRFGDNLTLVEKIDPALLAGYTIRVGDEVIDASLSNKLENIRKELA